MISRPCNCFNHHSSEHHFHLYQSGASRGTSLTIHLGRLTIRDARLCCILSTSAGHHQSSSSRSQVLPLSSTLSPCIFVSRVELLSEPLSRVYQANRIQLAANSRRTQHIPNTRISCCFCIALNHTRNLGSIRNCSKFAWTQGR